TRRTIFRRDSSQWAKLARKMPAMRQTSHAGKNEPTMSRVGAREQPESSPSEQEISKRGKAGNLTSSLNAFRKFDKSLSRRDNPIIAHGFNRGFRVLRKQEPRRGERGVSQNTRFLSSLTGLTSFACKHPALKRWAIFICPSG